MGSPQRQRGDGRIRTPLFQVRFRLSRIPFRLRCETIWNHSEQSDSDPFGLSRIPLFAILIPSSEIIPTSDFRLVGFGLSRIRTWSDSDSVRFGLDWIRTSSDPDFEFTFTIDSLKPQVGFRLSWHPRKVGIRLRRNPTFDFFGPPLCIRRHHQPGACPRHSDFGLPTSALQSESESDSSPIPTSRNRIPTSRN